MPAALRDLDLVAVPAGAAVVRRTPDDPSGAARDVAVPAFLMGRCEVTLAAFAAFLNAADHPPGFVPPGIQEQAGRFVTHRRAGKHPVSHVSFADAVAYCRWVSNQRGVAVRLPTETEWRYAASGGVRGAPYPWGWGDPEGRARFAAEAAGRRARYKPNAFGLHDMAGNVSEWCLPVGDPLTGRRPALGGSWSEREPRMLRIDRRTLFPTHYRNADVGFRILVERPERRGPAAPGRGRRPPRTGKPTTPTTG